MSWNHRLMARVYKLPTGKTEIYFEIHEVYYDKNDKPDSYTTNPVDVSGYSEKDIRWSLEMMLKCLNKPILWYGDKFPQEYKPIKK